MITPEFYVWEKRLAWTGFLSSLIVLTLIGVAFMTKNIPLLFHPVTFITGQNSVLAYGWALRFTALGFVTLFISAFFVRPPIHQRTIL